jgi:multidrug efflux pump subunit AcrA (membrane-fusion protein)
MLGTSDLDKLSQELRDGLAPVETDDLTTTRQLQSWELVNIPSYLRRYGWWAIRILVVGFLLLLFVPWTQTVTATGQLSAYSPYERPQDIEAQIIGRIKKWHVFEGVRVRQGELILELDDIDPNFLSPELLALLEQQKVALEQARKAALDRAAQLEKRIGEMENLVKAAVPKAEARVVEAENKVRAAEQRIVAAKIAYDTAELNVDRHRELATQGLVSQRELELTIQAAIGSKAELKAAEAQLRAAQQDMKALRFGRDQVSADVLQQLLHAEASRAEALVAAARASEELASVSLRLSNAVQRRLYSRIVAPIDGTVVRMAQVGAGETVRQGDKLVRISPTSADKAAELVADGLDAPLLNTGRKVRLLFYGVPALPLPAWPELMAGSFGGVIKVVDQVDDGKGNFRFWVVPDPDDHPWPEQACIGETIERWPKAWPWTTQVCGRQGMKIMGWVILNRVPLWYELWRRFNLFPPDYQEGAPTLLDILSPKTGFSAK